LKKYKSKKIIFNIIFLLFLSNFLFIIPFSDNNIETKVQDGPTPTLSNGAQILLHTYDFEDQTIDQNPTYETFTIDEASGDVYIDDLSDGQQKHMALHKVGTTGRVWVRDNFSLDGETYDSGEYHLKVYHDNSGFGINLNSANGEYILAMVWWNGEIRDDVYGTLLANYALNQWIDVVIYFDLDLGWMFDLDGVRYGAGYSIPFFGDFTAKAEHIWMTSFVSGGGDGYFRVDDISAYCDGINIVTPLNQTYINTMSGYYPATYGFESDLPGADAKNWTHDVIGGTHSYIVDSYNGHERVYELFDNAAGNPDTYTYFNNQLSGTVEAWVLVSLSDYVIYFDISQGTSPVVRLILNTGAYLIAMNNSVQVNMTEFGIIQKDQWYHIRVDFRSALAGSYMGLADDSYRIYLNGVQCNSDLLVNIPSTQVNRVTFLTGGTAADPNYYVYFDAIGFSWDPYYTIGANLNEGLLLSYENSTSLDWQGYSLDGQNNKTIFGNSTIPMPEYGLHTIQIFGNKSSGIMHQSDVRYFTVDFPIDIITPEAKTYNKAMEGYYLGTYGFECDENNNFPKGWTNSSGANGYAKVIDGIGGHSKVLECYSSLADNSRVDSSIFFDPQEHGSFEFWWYKSSSYTSAAIVDFWGETPGVCISIRVDHWPSANNDKVEYQASAGYLDTGYASYTDNKWMHFRINFNCSSDTYSLWIDQVKYLDNIDFLNSKDETGVNQMRFDSYNAANAVLYNVDAVRFSWDLGYSVGDNLNEGLLLSYDNSTELDWIGYSLDGQTIKTILGNTTIPMPENGLHRIQVFGNDSFGTNYSSEIRYFTVAIEVKGDVITFLQRYSPYFIFLIIAGLCGLIWFIKKKFK